MNSHINKQRTKFRTAFGSSLLAAFLCVGMLAGCKDMFHPGGSKEKTEEIVSQMPSNLSLNDTLTWISNYAVEGSEYTITVRNNETIEPKTLSYSGKTVGITLTGGSSERTISLSTTGSLFTVGSGVTLTLGYNVTLWGRNNNTTSLVYVNSGGRFVMHTDSKIRGNITNYWGGGVYVSASGTFTMNGGTISGNTASDGGGGVYVNGGAFTMNGGTISGNTALDCGGVVLTNGTFTMSGGTISSNTASGGSGGVGVFSGIFTMNEGTISGNTGRIGGGVGVFSGTFTMSGGTISGNTSMSGGGVFVMANNGGTFTKQLGGVIYGSNESNSVLRNTATSGTNSGHAVYVSVSPIRIRNTTAGVGVTMNSAVSGSAGGWE
jgi:hypothetical protein